MAYVEKPINVPSEHFFYQSKELNNNYSDLGFNYSRVVPVNGTTFTTTNNTIKFRLASASQFWDPKRSYLKYKVQLTGGTASSSNLITKAGLACGLIDRLQTSLNGQSLEDISRYGQMVAMEYQKASTEYLNFLKATEHVNDTGCLTSGNAYNKVSCVHALHGALFNLDLHLPLPIITNSGMDFTLFLAPLKQLMQSNATTPATDYEITDIEFFACMVDVNKAYLDEVLNKAKAGEIKIPITLTQSQTNYLYNSAENQHSLVTGKLKSLNSITSIIQTGADLASGTADLCWKFTRNTLTNYFFRVGSKRFPLERDLITDTTYTDAEQLMLLACTVGNRYQGLNLETVSDWTSSSDKAFEIYWNFQNAIDRYGSGISVQDRVELFTTFATAPQTSDRMTSFLQVDAIIHVKLGEALIVEK